MIQNSSICRLIRGAHLLLCVGSMAFVSWGLLAPDPLDAVTGTSVAFLCDIDDFLIHLGVFATATCLNTFFVWKQRQGVRDLLIVLMLAYAVATELLQVWIPSRTCDPLDMLANITGILAGLRLAESLAMGIAALFRLKISARASSTSA